MSPNHVFLYLRGKRYHELNYNDLNNTKIKYGKAFKFVWTRQINPDKKTRNMPIPNTKQTVRALRVLAMVCHN